MKAIFIDAKNCKVEEIDFTGNYKDIQKKLDVDLFTTVGLNAREDTLYVDDEGLLNGTKDYFLCSKLYPTPLAGNGLILGTDEEGESVSTTMTLAELGPVVFAKLEGDVLTLVEIANK